MAWPDEVWRLPNGAQGTAQGPHKQPAARQCAGTSQATGGATVSQSLAILRMIQQLEQRASTIETWYR
jgi:hypothetical protein